MIICINQLLMNSFLSFFFLFGLPGAVGAEAAAGARQGANAG